MSMSDGHAFSATTATLFHELDRGGGSLNWNTREMVEPLFCQSGTVASAVLIWDA